MTKKEMEDYEMLVEMEVTTANELNLVKSLMGGSWTEVISNVCYYYTGYHNVDDFLQEME